MAKFLLNPKNLPQMLRALQPGMISAALRYNAAVTARNRRFRRARPHGPWQTTGAIRAIEANEHGAILRGEHGALEIYFLSPEVVRVRAQARGEFRPPFSYAVVDGDGAAPAVECQSSGASYRLQTSHLLCEIAKDSGRLTFKTPDGTPISEDTPGLAWRAGEVRWSRRLPEGELCYGLGERAGALNLRGRRLRLWNSDPQPAYPSSTDALYVSIPFYLGVQRDRACGIFWDNPARGWVDLGADQADRLTFQAEGGELRFYLMVGSDAPAVLQHYTALTGRTPLPPLWALGFHQSRWGYNTEADFREIADEFRRRRLPCDALYFDIEYMDGYRCFTWNRECFPRLQGLISELGEQGFKAVAILDPGIKIDPGYAVYESGLREDIFLKYPDGQVISGPVWPGACHFPDFTSPRARAWWGKQFPPLLEAGFAGFWNDMNEPTLINMPPHTTLPDYVPHDWEGQGCTHGEGGHNVYGMQMARASREAIQQHVPDRRVFNITRAGYAGVQRYASSWTGDNAATWEHLRLSVSMVLNLGLSGLAFTGPDVGGFMGDPDPELFTRWMQLGSMLPFFRVHSMMGSARREPWEFGETHEAIIRRTLELRYQLLPYLYSTFAQCTRDGLPVVRPLFIADPKDVNLREIDDAFLLGDTLLIAPIMEPGAEERRVYLPRGVWYEFGSGKLIDGARELTAAAPLDTLPIYVRAGKVLPLWPIMQYVGERTPEELRLRVYAGSGETSLYEDAGEGMAYQQGDYRWSYFSCRFLPSGQFALDWRRAGRYHPPYQQTRVEIVGISGDPERVDLDGQRAPVWYYESGTVEFIVKEFGTAQIIGRSAPESPAAQTRPRL